MTSLFDAPPIDQRRNGVFLLRRGEGSSAVPLARAGEPAPGGGIFDQDIAGYSINDSGDVAIAFELKLSNPLDLKGFGTYGLFRYSHADRKLTARHRPGVTPAPGFGVFLSTGVRPTLNNSGDMVFAGSGADAARRLPHGGFGAGNLSDGPQWPGHQGGGPRRSGTRRRQVRLRSEPLDQRSGRYRLWRHVAGEECIGEGFVAGPWNWCCFESVYFRSAAKGTIESIAHQGELGPMGISTAMPGDLCSTIAVISCSWENCFRRPAFARPAGSSCTPGALRFP